MQSNFETAARVAANYVPLSPISHLNRAAKVHGTRPAVVYGKERYDWAAFAARVRAVAGGLQALDQPPLAGDDLRVWLWHLHARSPLG